MKYAYKLHCNLPNNSRNEQVPMDTIARIAQHADAFQYNGVLSHFNFQMMDPFVLGTWIIQRTKRLSPIIAVQPNYCSPLEAAKMVQTIARLYGRRVILNMITGAAKSELEQVQETLSHDERYVRLAEYMHVLKLILSTAGPVYFAGDYYKYNGLQLYPELEPELMPTLFVAGSSAASMEVALQQADLFMTHPGPVPEYRELTNGIRHLPHLRSGIKIGVIARETKEEAWMEAHRRFPVSATGKMATKMKAKSESVWLRQMAELTLASDNRDEVFWMGGFASGIANNPILVGDYEQVSQYIGQYVEAGVNEIIVAGLLDEHDFRHTAEVFKTMDAAQYAHER
ncbi:LLM class flavin-dependent oxidoreductase [Paenibacillus athensensis]|nr:LLM class flavin-dependent oxidoreductase [Paenibacillus athensensis]MCD1257416.1 LLM class flavin-dependent oxidoreductase [Paenibacillus athensensis]